MKALLLKEYMKLELVEMPEPEIGAHDVLVRVRACGICGSGARPGRQHRPAGAAAGDGA